MPPMIAVEIAISVSTIEMMITVRSCPSVRGNPSLRKPSANERTSAHTNRRTPPIQKGFTRRKLPDRRLAVGHRTEAGGWLRQRLAMGAAARGARAARPGVVGPAAPVVFDGRVLGGHRLRVDRPPDDPAEGDDRDLQPHHQP